MVQRIDRKSLTLSPGGKSDSKERTERNTFATVAARQLRAGGKLIEAKELLVQQLRLHPRREERKAARQLLGEINTQMFFSSDHTFGKTEYIVQRGDSLWRISRQLNSNPDLIRRTNNLTSDQIHPGDRLLVPEGDFTLVLDLPDARAIVLRDDFFFRQYPIVAVDLPRSRQAQIRTKIAASIFWKDDARLVAPSEEERAESTPWLYLAQPGYVLYGVSEDEEELAEGSVEIAEEREGTVRPDQPPGGIALLKNDLREIELLIERGTPATVIRTRR